MRVLVVNQYFPPDRSATATMVAAAVVAYRRNGHDVTVLAGRPSYDPGARRPWRPVQREHHEGARVVRVGSTAADRRHRVGRAANYASFGALAPAAGMAQRFDVVVGMTDPPFAGAVAALIARARRAPFVYWVQDFHPDFAVAAGLIAEGRTTRMWRASQRATLRAAAGVVVLGDDMAERVCAAGAAPDRVHVVPNGAAHPPAPGPAGLAAGVAADLRKGYELVTLYGGNLGYAGAWDALVDGAARLDPRVHGLVFIGDGADRSRIVRRAANVPNVRVIDRLADDEYAAAVAAADLQVVTVRRGLEGLVVPMKLYDALAVGRAILAVAGEGSDVVRVVRRHRCGIVADPDVPETIAAALRWAADHPDDLRAMGERARSAGRQYERAVMMQRLVEITTAVAAAGPGA
jgi:glycosyltransferase involved in cell wall biosynthesis